MGFEPTYDGFANRCVTTSQPRQPSETVEFSLPSLQTLLRGERGSRNDADPNEGP